MSVEDVSVEDGGPAFGEFQQVGNCSVKVGGMSLRDYFAAKVIAGLSANSGVNGFDFDQLAAMAYAQADLMLMERAK
jgi:hypothetical protein